jgi:small-conductance mechanosensitive channel
METINSIFEKINRILSYPLLELGESAITVWLLLYITGGIFLLFFLTIRLNKLLVNHILTRYTSEIGIRQAIGGIVRYVLIFIGLLIILQTAGINLSSLTVLAGALGIGIGFGLQHITNNFVSGIIILFERPIKVGDRIEIGETHGMVASISARATTIITNDNVSIIVPNSEFMQTQVINWSHNDYRVRFRIPVDVAYGSDVDKIIKLLKEVGAEDPDVLEDPPTTVRLKEFGDNGIRFELLVWTTNAIHTRGRFMSNINIRIMKKFNNHGVVIPFPQRDVYIKEGPGTDK